MEASSINAEVKPAERYPWRSNCEFDLDGVKHRGFVVNISETGLFVQTRTPAKKGIPLNLRIPQKDGLPEISFDVRVVRRVRGPAGASGKNVSGIGVTLINGSDAYTELLQRFQDGRRDTVAQVDAALSLFRVRVIQNGSTRSRLMTVQGISEPEARQKALEQISDDWNIIEIARR